MSTAETVITEKLPRNNRIDLLKLALGLLFIAAITLFANQYAGIGGNSFLLVIAGGDVIKQGFIP